MIKDIIVNLSVTKNNNVVGNYAASVAAALQAHLTGVAFIYDAVADGGHIPAHVIERQQAAAAESAIKSFTAATSRGEISAEPLTLNTTLAGAGDQFKLQSACFEQIIHFSDSSIKQASVGVGAMASGWPFDQPLLVAFLGGIDLHQCQRGRRGGRF